MLVDNVERGLMAYRLSKIAASCLALVMAVTACPDVRAQTPVDPEVIVKSQENQSAGLAAAWLGSSDPRVRAWGAYLALRDRRRELLPQLVGLTETYLVTGGSPASPTEYDERAAMLGVLDAIVQIDGRYCSGGSS